MLLKLFIPLQTSAVEGINHLCLMNTVIQKVTVYINQVQSVLLKMLIHCAAKIVISLANKRS